MEFESRLDNFMDEFNNISSPIVHSQDEEMHEIDEHSSLHYYNLTSDIKNYFMPDTDFHDPLYIFSLLGEVETLTANPQEITVPTLKEFNLEKKKSERVHLVRKRTKVGEKTSLQLGCKNGYWTKNFLPFGKNPHFEWIDFKMGVEFVLGNTILLSIREKSGIKMQDYLILYKMQELKNIWPEFFRKGKLYRELMLSRTVGIYKVIFAKFLRRYEEAFNSGIFDHIA